MSLVGQNIPMLDAEERVTGRLNYVLNFELPGMLVGKILRSPEAHARVIRVDPSRAERLAGVETVLTRADFSSGQKYDGAYGRIFRDQLVLAADKVRFVGDPVAAVAAVSDDVADEALKLIEVEYEPLPAVFDPEGALKPGAPLVHDPRPEQRPMFAGLIQNLPGGSNLCSHFKLRRGDIERGLRESDLIFEDVFCSPAVQHVPLEPHVTLAHVSGGKLTLWTSTQMPHPIRAQMAELFQLPLSSVRVITQSLGGGFGSKGSLRLEPITAFLALKVNRPVKVTLTREEEFVTVCKHPATIHLKTGVKRDGTLVARQVTAYFNTGAYTDVGPVVARNGGSAMSGPYRIPHVKIDSMTVWTNQVPAGALRGFGVPQAVWAYETQMDMIAERLGMDPLVLRRQNMLRDGDLFATGEKLEGIHYDALLDQAAARVGWSPSDARWLRKQGDKTQRAGVRRGKGIALVIKGTITPSTSSSALKLNEDGSVNVLISSVELGQGAKTVLAQIAAESTGVPIESVSVSDPDTDVTPFDQQTSSSRTTFSMGNAVMQAAEDLKRQLREHAAEILEVAKEDMQVRHGRVEVIGAPGRSLGYGNIVVRSGQGSLMGCGAFTTRGGLDLETGQGIGSVHWHQGAIACEAEVDLESGKIRVLVLHPSVFAGRVINPRLCELQLEGSACFGVGQALYEEMVYDESGQLLNRNLGEYTIPSFEDIPASLEVGLLEAEGTDDIHGVGETLLPPVTAAIGNAIYNASGVRIKDLPITPEKLLRGIQQQRDSVGVRPTRSVRSAMEEGK